MRDFRDLGEIDLDLALNILFLICIIKGNVLAYGQKTKDDNWYIKREFGIRKHKGHRSIIFFQNPLLM